VYPIWPKRKKPPKRQGRRQNEGTANKREIKFVQGPSLEEEMAEEREEDTEEIEEINEMAIKRWPYYALGEEPDEEGPVEERESEEEMYFREDDPTEQEDTINVELCTISPRGHLISRDVWKTLHTKYFVPLTRWGRGVMGRACEVYPHPEQWTIEDSPGGKPLDQIGVNEIYRAFMVRKKAQPNCIHNWNKRLGIDIPWRAIGENITKGLGTNRDTSSWFKNIVHRALYLKGRGGQNTACSACHQENEDWIHQWQCPLWAPTWEAIIEGFNELLPPIQGRDRVQFSPSFIYLGLTDEDSTPHALPGSLALLHAILWKFIIIELYKISQNEYYEVNTDAVERSTMRRYITRIRANLRKAQIARIKNIHRGEEHSNDKLNKKLYPVASINDACDSITWHPVVHRWLAIAGAEEHEAVSPVYTPEW
jgi:hypothetical protein